LEISIGLEVDASGVVSLGASAEGAGVWGADWWKISVKMFWKASSTLVESRALVSMNDNPFFSANSLAVSVGTSTKP